MLLMKSNLYFYDHPCTNEHASTGSSTSGEPKVLVLIHGLFGDANNLSVIRRHAEQYFRVISIDLPDHGLSPRSSAFSFVDYAQQIADTLQSLSINKAHFVGHSLGGKVAMSLAHLHQDLVDKLIVLDIAPVAYPPHHQTILEGLLAIELSALTKRKDAQLILAKYVPEAGTQAFLLKALYQEDGQWHWRFNLRMLVEQYDKLRMWPFEDKLMFERPVLFIKGEQSNYISAKNQAQILRQFPKASAKVVNAGHWLHAEKPQIVNTLITKHLLG